jgi:RimJ/RimL family protein N-acetyltransferase
MTPAWPPDPGLSFSGRHARLEPLEERHAPDLLAQCAASDLWRYMPMPAPPSLDAMNVWIREARERAAGATERPFAILDAPSGRAIGSTRYLDIRPEHRGLEVGWTWLGPAFQRTAINTECKLMLLTHAFESMGAVRVQLKTDARNLQSQRAIERLGAVREGVLRRHMILWDGYVRDSVMFSISDLDWPEVRTRLQGMLSARS